MTASIEGMNFTNLPKRLRTAGVAWVVSETGSQEAARQRAHHWAVMRGLPFKTESDHDAAIADALSYRARHERDVQEFLAYRERERRRQ